MIYEIKNQYLTAAISTKGAELQSIKDRGGTEYLWQGDPAYWPDRALNIFPYVARLTQGKYILDGQEYSMDIHGFVCTSQLEAEKTADNRICFRLEADEATRMQYPYDFLYEVCYELDEKRLNIIYSVVNKGEKTMYFGIGGHPGFGVPFEENTVFEDYYLEFSETCKPIRIGFSEDCFLNGEDTSFLLEDHKILSLHHRLFDDDAIVLKNMAKEVTLKSKRGNKAITVTYPDMKYLGLWHASKMEAPYICIEPWSSLPSRKNVIEDLKHQPDLVSLAGYGVYRNQWSIGINSDIHKT